MVQKCPIYLASASPRRKDILSQMGIKFHVLPADVSEECECEDPAELVRELSFRKAKQVVENLMEDVAAVIGSDTVVAKENHILGKPVDREHARKMIQLLSGGEHQVHTGVTIAIRDKGTLWFETFSTVSRVYVMEMSDEEIEDYLSEEEYADKAGAYAIQGRFGRFIEGFSGDYYTVVGLPMNELYKKLKEKEIILV